MISRIVARARWWRWFFRTPDAPAIHNIKHPTAKIDMETYWLMFERWRKQEPDVGAPPRWRNSRFERL